jgi:hypothetical protein
VGGALYPMLEESSPQVRTSGGLEQPVPPAYSLPLPPSLSLSLLLYWELTSEPHSCKSGALPLEPLCQLFLHWLFLR